MDRAVHRRPGFAANIAMASDRIAYYECGNGENPRGWHTGAGMLSWWADGRVAGPISTRTGTGRPSTGTASPARPSPPNASPTGRAASGASPSRTCAGSAARPTASTRPIGQHLKGLGSTLEARKSWFCVADAIVCLGAGITCTDGVPVETVVDNRNLGEGGTQTFVRGPGLGAPGRPRRLARPGPVRPAHPPRGPHRRLVRHQHHQHDRTPHPPLADPLARPRHRPGGRHVRLRPPARRLPPHGRRPRRRPPLAVGPRQRLRAARPCPCPPSA